MENVMVKRIEIARGAFNSILKKKTITVRHISMEKKLYKHMCGRHFYTDVKHGQ